MWVLSHLGHVQSQSFSQFCKDLVTEGSYYTSIGRTKYSRALLQRAETFSAEQSISQQQAMAERYGKDWGFDLVPWWWDYYYM